MLTTSPRIPNSANASPTAFHYAPTRSSSSPQSSSPSRLSASLARRHSGSRSSSHPTTSPSSLPQTKSPTPPASSTTSITTTTTASSSKQPPQKQTATTPCPRTSQSARPPHYVAVDAGTQYSPMEPVASAPSSSAAPDVVDMNATVTTAAATAITASQTPIESPPPAPQPKPIEPTKPETGPVIIEPEPSAPIVRQQTSDSVPSPGKRRKSRDDGAPALLDPSTGGGGSGVGVVEGSNAPKRQRPAPPPQKVLPQRYEFCSWEDMVVLIAHMLSELIETNDALALQSGNLTRFHSRTAPSISVLEYLSRLAKHATLTPPLLLSMVYYIDRLCALYPEFTINTLTVHRFLITAATVAAKGLSDSFWNNTTYARVGGVRVAELKLLELEFLYRVDWKIVPNPEVLVAYYRGLVERCPGYILEGEQPADEAEGDADEEGDSTDVSDEAAEHSDASDEKNITSATGLSPRPGGGG